MTKKLFFSIGFCFLVSISSLWAQTPIWTENFNNGCVEGCFANAYVGPNGAWTVNSAGGTNGANPNQWFVSCAENGMGAGNCGAACGSNATLHLGANPGSFCACFVCAGINGDCGAAYDACSAGSNFCGGGSPQTSARAESPVINTIGQTNLTLSFVYMERGQGVSDDATVQYSINSGASWIALTNPAKTPNTCGISAGRWTAFSIALPVACENIATLKIGFVWTNNVDDIGNDPSFAVDDVIISIPSALPLEFSNFSTQVNQNAVYHTWENSVVQWSATYYVERSVNGEEFEDIAVIYPYGGTKYNYIDEKPAQGLNAYRIKRIDQDGGMHYSKTNSVNIDALHRFELRPITYQSGNFNIVVDSSIQSDMMVKIVDLNGKIVYQNHTQTLAGTQLHEVSLSNLPSGLYAVQVYHQTYKELVTQKVIVF